jgi:rubrerythrin
MKALFFINAEHYSEAKSVVYADDVISRQTVNFREARALGFDKEGYYLEIEGSAEAIHKAKELLAHKAKEVSGHEKDAVLKKIAEQEESAAEGFGALFG